MKSRPLVFAAMSLAGALCLPAAHAQETKSPESRSTVQKGAGEKSAKPAQAAEKKVAVPGATAPTATQAPAQVGAETHKSKSGYRGSDCQHAKDVDA